jgi:hypothetical protein
VDSAGFVYVTGDSQVSDSRYDFTTVKYDENGKQAWVKRYAGPDKLSNAPAAIAVDSSGFIYVTGDSQASDSQYDFATVKYDENGRQAWVRRYDSSLQGADFPAGIALANSGCIYVTGTSYASDLASSLFSTLKYDANGNLIWSRTLGGSGKMASAIGIVVDSKERIYVTGSGPSGFLTVRYDKNGKQIWTATYQGPGKGTDQPAGLALDSAGYVYVTGTSYGTGTGADFATVKYAPGGRLVWAQRFNGAGNGDDFPAGIAVDSTGNAYVAGTSYKTSEETDFAIVKYGTDGTKKWVRYYTGK